MTTDDDALLTALIDGELDDADAAAINARLAAEPALAQRLADIRNAQLPLRAAFEVLAGEAPVARMAARLQPALSAPTRAQRTMPTRAAMAAAIGLGLFVGGILLGHVTGSGEAESWRTAVAQYMTLYSADTFAGGDPAAVADTLAALSIRLKTKLDADRLTLDGLAPQRVEALQYDDAPLGQIGYLDGDAPIALCIIGDGEADTDVSVASRDGFTAVSWAAGGRGFMAIGKAPQARMIAFASAARARLD
jgi:anti-sigma factor RsiW